MSNNYDTYTTQSIAEELLKRSIAQLSTGNYLTALENITQAIQVNPNYYDAYVVRASLIYPQLGKHQEIIEDYGKILELDPDNVEAYNNRGYIQANLGNYTEALKDYERAIDIDNKCIQARLNRGLLYSSRKKYQNAIADFNRVIQIDAHNADAYNNRGLIYYYQNDYQRAVADFNMALKLAPNHVNAYLNRGTSRICLNDITGALEDFDLVSIPRLPKNIMNASKKVYKIYSKNPNLILINIHKKLLKIL